MLVRISLLLTSIVIFFLHGIDHLRAEVRSSLNYSTQAETRNQVGNRIHSSDYTVDASVGGIIGTSSSSPLYAAKYGYAGQLFDSNPDPSQVDSDGDGLPDQWEVDNGLDRFNPTDADEDHDLDGMSNRNEFKAGTNPQDSSSLLFISSFRNNSLNQYILSWQTVTDRNYNIFWSPVNGETNTLAADIPGVPPENTHTDTFDRAKSVFYWIEATPQ